MNPSMQNPLRVVKLLGRATILTTPRVQNHPKGKESPNIGPLRRVNNTRFSKPPIVLPKNCKVVPIKAFDFKRDRDRHVGLKNTTERTFNATLDKTLRVSQSVRILPKTETVFECSVESGIKKIIKREEDTKMECPKAYKLVDGGIKKIIRVDNNEVTQPYIARRTTMSASQSVSRIDKKLFV